MAEKEYEEIDLKHNFLEPLRLIPDSPKSLWLRGKLPDVIPRPKVVSIVGSRRCTRYGEAIAYKTAYELAEKGIMIVSGMAYGIDAFAHRGCLDAGGTTVAVLGTPIDYIYPASNRSLAERILQKGGILSEYAPGTQTRNWHFLERNRIVSGLADALLIVEASDHSGTLTTASLALDQGKDVFVVPGDITRPMSVGCNRLISQGAQVFTELNDILSIVAPEKLKHSSPQLEALSEIERSIWQQIKDGIVDGDEIMENLKLDVSDFNQAIMSLELKRYIKTIGFNRWMLC